MGQVKDEKYEGSGQDQSDRVPHASCPPLASRLVPLACNGLAIALIFWGFFQLDRSFLEYMRTVHIQSLEQVGDLFYLIGTGGGLVTISILLLAAGYLFHEASLRRSGLESLIAHGIVALVAQLMKHTIGRPRPRMMREEEFFTGPSLVSGLDSFPSGHASASFAVAAVVARHRPTWAWPAYGLAGLIASSRVVRGSHFATDVAFGIVLGLVVGSVVARPLREWRTSASGALIDSAPWLAVALAILWTLCQPITDQAQDAMMLWTGSVAVAFGVGSRWGSAFRGEPSAFLHYATPAICLGLALTTGAWPIVVIAALMVMTQWLGENRGRSNDAGVRSVTTLAVETVIAAVLLLAVLCVQSMKGALVLA